MKILRAGTLIDGTGAPPVRDAAVVIHNGRIETVTTSGASAGPPADHEVIDASRLTVLPGLIDCHDHLAFHGYELVALGPRRAPEHPAPPDGPGGGPDPHVRLHGGARRRRARRGLPPRGPRGADPRAAPGPVARDHLADRRGRRPPPPPPPLGATPSRSPPSPNRRPPHPR